jgi:hypothetical protein
VDALKASGYAEPLEQVFAKGQMVFGAAMLVGTLGGGLLGQIVWPMRNLGRLIVQTSTGLVSYNRVADILRTVYDESKVAPEAFKEVGLDPGKPPAAAVQKALNMYILQWLTLIASSQGGGP